MANIGFFNSNEVAPAEARGTFPPGEYTAAIVESDVATNKKGTGKYIKAVWQILDEGPAKGRKIWQYINFENANEVAQRIGQGELSSICRACGKAGVKDTSELHNIPVKVKVGIEKDDRGEKNTIGEVLWKLTAKKGVVAPVTSVSVAVDDDNNDPIPF